MGRPLKDIDEAEVAKLASRGITNHAIAVILGCDADTIKNRFSALCTKKRIERKLAIHDAQWEILTGDDLKARVTMSIWLGKNELDQTDKAHATVDQTVRTTKVVKLAPDPGEPDAS